MQYSTSWSADDPEQAAHALAPRLRNLRITPGEQHFGLTVAEAGDDTVSLVSLHWSAAGEMQFPVDGFIIIGHIDEGAATVTRDGAPVDTTGPMLIPWGVVTSSWDDAHLARTLLIEQAAIDDYARDHFDAPTLRVAFTESRPVSPAHAALWRAAERFAREDVFAHPEHLHNDLLWNAGRAHLLATALAAFPNTTHELADARGGGRALPASVRRAVTYMEEHIAEPVTLPDLAAVARLSPRGLLDAFRRTLDTTPTRHLRALRLEAARKELRQSSPDEGATVAEIARRWGFAHPARFAQQYRERFDEAPSATLRRER